MHNSLELLHLVSRLDGADTLSLYMTLCTSVQAMSESFTPPFVPPPFPLPTVLTLIRGRLPLWHWLNLAWITLLVRCVGHKQGSPQIL